MVHGRAGYRNVWEWLGWSCDESQYASVVEQLGGEGQHIVVHVQKGLWRIIPPNIHTAGDWREGWGSLQQQNGIT